MNTIVLSAPSAVLNPAIYNHPVEEFKVIETHISWVVLTGPYAYKIKKPVDLGFLDFSTLDKRHFYCQEEVRINRRLCPSLYEGVVALTGDPEHLMFNGPGRVHEFMVKMKQFDEELLWDRMLQRNELKPADLDALGVLVANFHQSLPPAPPQSSFGRPETFWGSVEATLEHVIVSLHGSLEKAFYEQIAGWIRQELDRKADLLLQRLKDGYVREGHGDLHLRNIALFSRQRPDIQVFDAIEFDDNLRWIDMINDVAFLFMDLEHRGRPDMAWRFLNTYLERTGDYAGLELLRLYTANRALVRAKVLGIQTRQEQDRRQKVALHAEVRHFLRTAESYTHPALPCLYITHGLSGSGKTTWTKPLADQMGAVRIRSDIERKRLFGLRADESSSEELKRTMYSAEGNARTYARLKDLAAKLLRADVSVIIDAAFLRQEPRQAFRDLALHSQAGFRILDFHQSEEELRRRVAVRWHDRKDASEADLAVLEDQISHHEGLTEEENAFVVPAGSNL